MTKTTITIGLNYRDTGIQTMKPFEAVSALRKLISKYYPECEIYTGVRIYSHKDGYSCHENIIRLELINCESRQFYRVTQYIKRFMMVETLLIERTEVDREWV